MAMVVSSRRSQELASTAISTVAGRGLVEGLATPHPIVQYLPSALQEDDFCRRMVRGLDDVLAPIFNALDCFDSYLDPSLAPEDFVDWLASWVGLEVDETWTVERRRELIRNAAALYRVRGTAAGLAAHIRLYCGVTPEISENGGCGWSQTADSPLPGAPEPRLAVRVTVEDESAVRKSTLSRIVDASRPAHVPYHLEVVVGGTTIVEEAPSEGGAADAPGAVALPGSEHIELAPQGPEPTEEDELEAASTGDVPSGAVGPQSPPPDVPTAEDGGPAGAGSRAEDGSGAGDTNQDGDTNQGGDASPDGDTNPPDDASPAG